MTTDFRALCAELVESVEVLLALRPAEARPLRTTEDRLSRARAALADEPAVPQGREPAAVTGQPRPMDEDWDALVNRLWSKYETIGYQGERFMYEGDFCTALDLVRQEIAHWGNPAPAPPADGEVAELAAWLRMQGEAQIPGPNSLFCDKTKKELRSNGARLTRAAELLQRQALPEVDE